MKCQQCDCILTDYESVRKDPITKQYLDICLECLYPRFDDYEDQIEEQTISLDELLEVEDKKYDELLYS